MSTPPLLRRILTVLGWILLTPVVLIAGLAVLGGWQNARAERDATVLCERIRPNQDEAEALRLGADTRAMHLEASGRHLFRFQGGIFNAFACEVQVNEGKVSRAGVVAMGD
jgi:hypothetical protein